MNDNASPTLRQNTQKRVDAKINSLIEENNRFFQAEREKRNGLIEALEQELQQTTQVEDLFIIRWKVA